MAFDSNTTFETIKEFGPVSKGKYKKLIGQLSKMKTEEKEITFFSIKEMYLDKETKTWRFSKGKQITFSPDAIEDLTKMLVAMDGMIEGGKDTDGEEEPF